MARPAAYLAADPFPTEKHLLKVQFWSITSRADRHMTIPSTVRRPKKTNLLKKNEHQPFMSIPRQGKKSKKAR